MATLAYDAASDTYIVATVRHDNERPNDTRDDDDAQNDR